MKEAHGDPRAYAVRGLEGGDVAISSPVASSLPVEHRRRESGGRASLQ